MTGPARSHKVIRMRWHLLAFILLSACQTEAPEPPLPLFEPLTQAPVHDPNSQPVSLRAIGRLTPMDEWERWVVAQGEHRVVEFELENVSATPVEFQSHGDYTAWLDDGFWSFAKPLEDQGLPPEAILGRWDFYAPQWFTLEPGAKLDIRRAMRAAVSSEDVRLVGLRTRGADGALRYWDVRCEPADLDALPLTREYPDGSGWESNEFDRPHEFEAPQDDRARIRMFLLDQEPVDPAAPYDDRWCTIEIQNGSDEEISVLASKNSIWFDYERWHPEYGLWELWTLTKCGNCLEPFGSVSIPPGGSLRRRVREGGVDVVRPLLELNRGNWGFGGPWIRCEGPPTELPGDAGVPSTDKE
jgi:hypothetical protein